MHMYLMDEVTRSQTLDQSSKLYGGRTSDETSDNG